MFYLADTMSLICGYAAKTIAKNVIAYVHVEIDYLGQLPKFPTLADFVKGEKYLFQRPYRDRAFLSF